MSAKSPNPKDQRVQRTDQRLRDAFISLVHERGYEAVAIRDVVKRAGVGRSTFYTHYGDLEELHGQWLKDFAARSSGRQPLLDFARSFIEHAHPQRGSWPGVGRKSGGVAIERRFRQNLVTLALAEVRQIVSDQSPAMLETTSRYLAGAFAEVLFWWIDAPTALSPGELDEILRRLTASALGVIQHTSVPRHRGAG